MVLEINRLRVKQDKTKVMTNQSEVENKKHQGVISHCSIPSRKEMLYAVLFKGCCKRIHGRCTKVKRATPQMTKNVQCGRCKHDFRISECQKRL